MRRHARIESGNFGLGMSGMFGEPTPNPSQEGNLRAAAATMF
jgi:hypothetical protein